MADQVLHIGEVLVQRVEEMYGPGARADALFPSWDPSLRDDIGPDAVARFVQPETDLLLRSGHTWLVRTPQRTILVDTCIGNHKHRSTDAGSMLDTNWLANLAAAGVHPNAVDAVVCTHLHLDHIGWNTHLVDGRWVPTFPNATYYVNATEYDFWNPAAAVEDRGDWEAQANLNAFEDSMLPVFDHDLIEFWHGDGYQVDDSLRLELKPGHTPGHCVGWIESGGQRGLLSGDIMHNAVQAYRPEWNSAFCHDAEAAIATRRWALETAVELNAVLLPAHFSAPHAFHVAATGNGFSVTDAL